MTARPGRSSGMSTPLERLHGIAADAGIVVSTVSDGVFPAGLALEIAEDGTTRRTILLDEGLAAGERAAALAFCIAAFTDQRTERRLRRHRGRFLPVGTRPQRSAHRGVAALAQQMLRSLGQEDTTTFRVIDIPDPRPSHQPTA